MPAGQKFIYYAAGESIERIEKLPQAEFVADKGYELLYFTDDVDEFAVKVMGAYKDLEFKSVSSGDLGIEAEESKSSDSEDNDMFAEMKSLLADKVTAVRASKRLKSHPVCLSNEGELTIEMEKILNAMPNNEKIKAEKVLEINVNHDVFKALQEAFTNNKEKFTLFTDLLYNQALLIEGLPVEDPVEFTNNIWKILH
jgi:molecular chaperone HtpG